MKKFSWDKISKEEPFKAPDGYFEELPAMIQSRVTAGAGKPSKSWVTYARWAVAPAIAAVLLLVFLIPDPESPGTETLLAEVPSEDLIAYLEYSDLSTDDLIDEIPAEYFKDGLMYDDAFIGEDIEDSDIDWILDNYNEEDFVL